MKQAKEALSNRAWDLRLLCPPPCDLQAAIRKNCLEAPVSAPQNHQKSFSTESESGTSSVASTAYPQYSTSPAGAHYGTTYPPHSNSMQGGYYGQGYGQTYAGYNYPNYPQPPQQPQQPQQQQYGVPQAGTYRPPTQTQPESSTSSYGVPTTYSGGPYSYSSYSTTTQPPASYPYPPGSTQYAGRGSMADPSQPPRLAPISDPRSGQAQAGQQPQQVDGKYEYPGPGR